MNTLAILIPAFNEGPRIGNVLDVVCNYPYNKRVVVIDDGSLDDTYEKAKKYPVEVLRHKENRGKGAALQTGINYVGKSKFWIFLDADLINLKHEHIDCLIRPLKQNPQLGMTIGMLTSGGKKNVDLAQRYFSILNGQRGLADFFVKNLPNLSWSRFGVEIFLNKFAQYTGTPITEPILRNITHHTKEEKYGFTKGLLYRLQMYKECIYSLFNWKKYLSLGNFE